MVSLSMYSTTDYIAILHVIFCIYSVIFILHWWVGPRFVAEKMTRFLSLFINNNLMFMDDLTFTYYSKVEKLPFFLEGKFNGMNSFY